MYQSPSLGFLAVGTYLGYSLLIPITLCSISLCERFSILFSSLRRSISVVMRAILLEAWSIQFFTSMGIANRGSVFTVFFAAGFLAVVIVVLLVVCCVAVARTRGSA